MKMINDFVGTWAGMIEEPITQNKRQGFLLTNGMRIFFSDYSLSSVSKGILSRRYQEVLAKVKPGTFLREFLMKRHGR
mgnify:CR=1 FL=1